MSAGEIAGLVITAALAGGALAIGVAVLLLLRCKPVGTATDPQREAWAGWLAAQLTLSRTAISFVAAFRALGAESRESANFQLRTEEAQRARADWSQAMKEYERAEATLIAWCTAAAIRNRLRAFALIEPAALRNAINGHSSKVRQLIQQLRRIDESAIQFVTEAIAQTAQPKPTCIVNSWIRRPISWVTCILQSWSDPK